MKSVCSAAVLIYVRIGFIIHFQHIFKFHLIQKNISEMFRIRRFICILFIIKLCSSETITLHGPNNTSYTYDNSSTIGIGGSATAYRGL